MEADQAARRDGSGVERGVRPTGYNKPPTGEPANTDDWNAGYEAGIADGVAAERERIEALRQALLKCKTCALPAEVRELVNSALRA